MRRNSLVLALGVACMVLLTASAAPTELDSHESDSPTTTIELLGPNHKSRSQKRKKSTEEVLRHMGMTQVRGPNNHHRKRLASQSRKSHNDKRAGDSHVYVIRLPPNKFYYDPSGKHHEKPSDNEVNRIPVDFKSNGKPGKIYHWNLPVIKKMMSRKSGSDSSVSKKGKESGEHEMNQVFKSEMWPRDEAVGSRGVSYFKPKKPSKQAFHKYFPGNGKPHTLYMLDRSHSPVSVQRIFT